MYLCRVCIHECMYTFEHVFLPLTWVSLAESQRAMACPGKWRGIQEVHQTRPMWWQAHIVLQGEQQPQLLAWGVFITSLLLVFVHTYHTHTHIHTITHAHIHTYTLSHMHTYTHTHYHTCTHTHSTHISLHVHTTPTDTCTHTSTLDTCKYKYTHSTLKHVSDIVNRSGTSVIPNSPRSLTSDLGSL